MKTKIIQLSTVQYEGEEPTILGLGADGVMYHWVSGETSLFTLPGNSQKFPFGTTAGGWAVFGAKYVYLKYKDGLPAGAVVL